MGQKKSSWAYFGNIDAPAIVNSSARELMGAAGGRSSGRVCARTTIRCAGRAVVTRGDWQC